MVFPGAGEPKGAMWGVDRGLRAHYVGLALAGGEAAEEGCQKGPPPKEEGRVER